MIDVETYEKVIEIVIHLEQNGYTFIEKIGDRSCLAQF